MVITTNSLAEPTVTTGIKIKSNGKFIMNQAIKKVLLESKTIIYKKICAKFQAIKAVLRQKSSNQCTSNFDSGCR